MAKSRIQTFVSPRKHDRNICISFVLLCLFVTPISVPFETESALSQNSCGRPVLIATLDITPYKQVYCVGDTLRAKFSIENKGDLSITLDVLTVGGRLDEVCPPEGCPDFTFHTVTLQPGEQYPYEGSLTLTKPGNYHFFIAYYIKNPTPEERKLLDPNNWNTCIDLEEGLEDRDRIEGIIVIEPPSDIIVYHFDTNNGYDGTSAWDISLSKLPEYNGYHLPAKEGYIAYEGQYEILRNENEYGYGYYINMQWPDGLHWNWDGHTEAVGTVRRPPGLWWDPGPPAHVESRNDNPARVLIYSPWSKKACIAVVGDSGPAPYGGRFGVSGKVFDALGLPQVFTRPSDGLQFDRGNPNQLPAGAYLNPSIAPPYVTKYANNPYWVMFSWVTTNSSPKGPVDLPPSDVTKDGKVDIMDLASAAVAYLSTAASLRWNPMADIDGNGLIDIIDIASIAKDFKKTAW